MTRGQTDDALWLKRLRKVFTSETDCTGDDHNWPEWGPVPTHETSHRSHFSIIGAPHEYFFGQENRSYSPKWWGASNRGEQSLIVDAFAIREAAAR
jgi:hypothetical protein